MDYLSEIKGKIPKEELLAQLAEEASELAKAALKMRRVLDGSNPTPVTEEEASANLLEEVADVLLCLKTIDFEEPEEKTLGIQIEKMVRWCNRLQNADRMDCKEDCVYRGKCHQRCNTCARNRYLKDQYIRR